MKHIISLRGRSQCGEKTLVFSELYPSAKRLNRFVSGMSVLIVLLLLFANAAFAQISGIKTVPGDYVSIQSFVSALNTSGVGAGGVTLQVAANHTETAPIGGIELAATGTLLNPITIEKAGAGSNPLITAYAGGTGTPATAVQDGVFRLVGSDYVTINGIDLVDTNSANPATMEYGYGLFKSSATDGCQHVAIKNCAISLKRVNNATGSGPMVDGAVGILSINSIPTATTTTLTVTATSGTNSENEFHANTISNCNIGIALIGFAAATPFTMADVNNDVGGMTLAQGNNITNFGGGGTVASAAIRTLAQYNLNVSYNTINNNDGGGVNHTGILRGIYLNTATSASATVSHNTITLHGGGTTSQVAPIENTSGSTAASNTIEISNNTISNCSYLTATSGVFYGIYNAASAAVVNILNNTISSLTYSAIGLTGSGAVYPIYNTGAAPAVNAKGNTINGISRTGTTGGTTIGIYFSSGTNQTVKNNTIHSMSIDGTGATCTMYGVQTTATTVVVDSNHVYDLSVIKITGSGAMYGIYNFGSPTNENYNHNSVYNLAHAGTGLVYGMFFNTTTGTRTLSYNTIYALTGNTTVDGIRSTTSSPNIFRNKIYNLTANTASGVVNGISLTSVGTAGFANLYYNLIGDLKAPAASSTTDVVRGINLTAAVATSTLNVYYNTIHLNASSTGTNFSVTGIYHTTSATANTSALDLRNNLVVNNSLPSGTGVIAAYRRSSATLTNYSSNSNNNLLYAGTPTASRLIFYDGTNSHQTIAAYKTAMVSRDQQSVSDSVYFQSTVGSSGLFLAPVLTANTLAESGAMIITGYTGDFSSLNARESYPLAGQVNGGGTKPDIGAREFDGSPSAPVIVLNAPIVSQCVPIAHAVSVNVTPNLGTTSSVILSYSFNGTPQTPVNMTNTTGNTWNATIPIATPSSAVVTWSVEALNSSAISSTYTGTSYQDDPLNGAVTNAYAEESLICTGTSATITAHVGKVGGSATVGVGGTTLGVAATAAGTALSPFSQYYESCHTQYLVKAEMLTASGLFPGNITSLTFNVTGANSTLGFSSYTVNIGHTAATALTGLESPTFTTVYGPNTYAAVTTNGPRTITFTTPFTWNGTSNLIVDICFANDPTGVGGNIYSANSVVEATAVGYVATYGYYIDDATICGTTSINLNTSTSLPVMTFGGVSASPMSAYSWSDGANIVGTTNPLIVNVVNPTNYSVTVTDPTGCTITYSSVPVNTYNSSLGGSYTVGSGGDFTTLTAAVAAYNAACNLTAPVVFNLTDASYGIAETFPITVESNPNASSVLTLTIKPAASNTASIQAAVNNAPLLRILGSHVILDGSSNGGTTRDLTVENTSITGPNVLLIGSTGTTSVTNVTAKNCIFINGVNTNTPIVVGDGQTGAAGYFTNISLLNNEIKKAYIGMYNFAVVAPGNGSGLNISGNKLDATGIDAIRICAIYVQGVDGATVSNNTVGNLDPTSAEIDRAIWLATGTSNTSVTDNTISGLAYTGTAANAPMGISITTGVAASNITVSGNDISAITSSGTTTAFGISLSGATGGVRFMANKIHNIKNTNISGYGAYGIGLASTLTAAHHTLVANNIISDIAGYGLATLARNGHGIAATAGSGYDIDHNTVVMSASQTAVAGVSAALYISTGTLHSVRNNIFKHEGTVGNVYGLYSTVANTAYTQIDYNDYYSVGNVGYLGSARTTLVNWQVATNQDLNSVSFDPQFVSVSDFTPQSCPLNNTALVLTGITTDYNDSVRSVTPDMGALEFTPDVIVAPVVTNPTVEYCLDETTVSLAATGTNVMWFTSSTGGSGSASVIPATTVVGVQHYFAAEVDTVFGCESVRVPLDVVVNPTTLVTSTTVGGTYCENSALDIAATAEVANPIYQWYQGATPVSAATSDTLSFASISVAEAGTYTLVIDGSCGSDTSDTVVIIVNPELVASAALSASSTSVCGAAPITFNVTPTNGGGQPSYAWTLNGNSVGTDSTGFFLNTPTDGDEISVIMTSNATPCLVNSPVQSNALVLSNSTVTPSVAINATATTVCPGTTVTFTSTGSDLGSAPSYDWKKNGVSTGVTTSSYAASSFVSGDIISLNVVSNASCTSTPDAASNPITITVLNSTAIGTQPSTLTQCVGTTAVMTVAASGSGTLTYQWKRNGTNVSGGTGSTLTMSNITALNAGDYTVSVTGTCGSVTSSIAPLVVNPATTITTQPVSGTLCAGASMALSTVGAGAGTLTYQWKKNGVAIPGATASSFNIPSLVTGDAGNYTVDVTGTCGTTTSSMAVRGVNLVAATASATNILCNGGSSVVTVAASGGSTPYTGTGNFSVNAGSYGYTVTDNIGCVGTTSITVGEPALLDVDTTAVVNVDCNGGATGGVGTVVTGGTGAVSYNWSNTSITNAVTNLSAGTYSVTVTDANNCTAATSTTITENTAIVSTALVDDENCDGDMSGAITYSTVGGVSPYDYVWNDPSSSTTASISGLGDGSYTVTVTDALACTLVESFSVFTLNQLPIVDITGPTSICGGASAVLDAGAGFVAYTWSNAQNSQTTSVTTTDAYIVTVVDVNGCSNMDTFNLLVYPLLINTPVITNTNCPGDVNGSVASSVIGGVSPYTYAWSAPLTQTTSSVTNLGEGAYVVTVTDFVGCTTTNTSTVGHTNSNPVVDLGGNQIICFPWGAATLDAGSHTSYVWSTGATVSSIVVNQSGTFHVQVQNQFGCKASDTVTVDSADCVGVDELQSGFMVNLYPNPTNGELFIRLDGASNATVNMSLFAMDGRLVQQRQWITVTDDVQSFDLNRLSKGVYIMVMNSDGWRATERIIVE